MEFIIGLILGVISSFILATYEKNKVTIHHNQPLRVRLR
jgi:hypothetical protein